MVNQHNQVVCDATKIILEDHVCLYPGYLEVVNGKITQNFSDDPNNNVQPFLTDESGANRGPNPEYKIGMLTNRKEFRRTQDGGRAPEELEEGVFHFLDADSMDKYIKTLKGADEIVEQVIEAVEEVLPQDEVTEEFKPFEQDPVGEVKDGLLPEEVQSEEVAVEEPKVKPKKESRVKKAIREVKEKIPMNKDKTMVSDPIPQNEVPASFKETEDGQTRCSVCFKRLIEVEQKEGVEAHIATHS